MKKRAILLGFLLRLLASVNKDFWFDEAISFAFAKQNITQLLTATLADNHPPLYYLFLHFWLKLGRSPLFLRFPSIIFGVISIYLFYLIGKTLTNRKVAIFSSILFALSPLHVYFSAETRMYSLWSMLTLAGFYFFLKILKKPKKIDYLIFNILFLTSLYTHYFSLIIFLALNFFLFIKRTHFKKQFFKLIFCQFLAGLIFLPWFFNFLSVPHPKSWTFSPSVGIPATFASFVIGGLGQVTLKTYLTFPSVSWLIKTYLVLVTTFLGLIFLKGLNSKMDTTDRLLIMTVLFLPIILTALIHPFFPVYSPRLFIASSFPFYLLVALGIENFKRKKMVIGLKITVILLLSLVTIQSNFHPSFKPTNLQQGTKLLAQNAKMEDNISHTSILSFYSFLYYLPQLKNQFLILPSDLTRQTTDIIGGTPKTIAEIKKRGTGVWLVANLRGTKQENLAHIQQELSGYFPILFNNFGDLIILLFSTPPRSKTQGFYLSNL